MRSREERDRVEAFLDDRIDAWHESDTKVLLHTFLGMSLNEYTAYISCNEIPDRYYEIANGQEHRPDDS